MDSFVERPTVDGGLGISSLSSLPPRPSPAVLFDFGCAGVCHKHERTPFGGGAGVGPSTTVLDTDDIDFLVGCGD